MQKNSYRQVQGKAVDELLSAAPPAGLTMTELEAWYNGAMLYLSEIEAETEWVSKNKALLGEPAIENDYAWIRGGC
jgi:hypothetical protein